MAAVTVIVPCRNEARHIDSFLSSVFGQTLHLQGYAFEVVVADGMSDDGTRERLQDWQRRQPNLIVVDNPKRITSAGLNLAIGHARSEIIVRMDVHTTYADDYVAQCKHALETTGATCVGGPWKPVGHSGLERAIAGAFGSRLGSGGAASRRTDYSGPVDTVYLGAWRREDLLRLGGFDEFLVRNQDDELNFRIIRSGGEVWQSADIHSSYTPRESLAALFRQFYQYGYWKVPVIQKHRIPASPRHLIPFAFVFLLLLLGLAALFIPEVWLVALLLIGTYLGAIVANAIMIAADPKEWITTAAALVCMHCGYGLGFGHGLLDFTVFRRGPRQRMTRLTR